MQNSLQCFAEQISFTKTHKLLQCNAKKQKSSSFIYKNQALLFTNPVIHKMLSSIF